MDDRDIQVPGAQAPSDVLRSDPLYVLLGRRLTNPVTLGIVSALIALAVIIFATSTESRFIYTDF